MKTSLFLSTDIIILVSVILGAILAIALIIYFMRKNADKRRLERHYKRVLKLRDKKYNANVVIDLLCTKYKINDTNTFIDLKGKGKSIVKTYVSYYQNSLSTLALYKSKLTPNKKNNRLVIVFKDERNHDLGTFHIKSQKRKLFKLINKHQLLFDTLAYLYELPPYIYQKKNYVLQNHDNKNQISYKILDEKMKKSKK